MEIRPQDGFLGSLGGPKFQIIEMIFVYFLNHLHPKGLRLVCLMFRVMRCPKIDHSAPHVICRTCFDPKNQFWDGLLKTYFLVRNCPNANLNSGDNWSGLSTWIKLLARFSPGGHLCAILSKLSFSPLLPLTALHQGLNAAYTSWVPTSSSSPSKYQVAFWSKKEDHLK